MKKLIPILFITLCTLFLAGCTTNCEDLSESACKTDQRCLNRYKPCSLSEEGCSKDNMMFVGCITKKAQN
jgi:hypothetical protein